MYKIILIVISFLIYSCSNGNARQPVNPNTLWSVSSSSASFGSPVFVAATGFFLITSTNAINAYDSNGNLVWTKVFSPLSIGFQPLSLDNGNGNVVTQLYDLSGINYLSSINSSNGVENWRVLVNTIINNISVSNSVILINSGNHVEARNENDGSLLWSQNFTSNNALLDIGASFPNNINQQNQNQVLILTITGEEVVDTNTGAIIQTNIGTTGMNNFLSWYKMYGNILAIATTSGITLIDITNTLPTTKINGAFVGLDVSGNQLLAITANTGYIFNTSSMTPFTFPLTNIIDAKWLSATSIVTLDNSGNVVFYNLQNNNLTQTSSMICNDATSLLSIPNNPNTIIAWGTNTLCELSSNSAQLQLETYGFFISNEPEVNFVTKEVIVPIVTQDGGYFINAYRLND